MDCKLTTDSVGALRTFFGEERPSASRSPLGAGVESLLPIPSASSRESASPRRSLLGTALSGSPNVDDNCVVVSHHDSYNCQDSRQIILPQAGSVIETFAPAAPPVASFCVPVQPGDLPCLC